MIYLLLSPDPSRIVVYGSSSSALRALLRRLGLPQDYPDTVRLTRLLRAGESVTVDTLSILPLPVLRAGETN